MKIELKDTLHFDREGFSGDIYIDKDDMQGYTTLLISVNGSHPRKRLLNDTIRTYFVISGEGEFTIDGEKSKVKENDYLIIKPQSIYEYNGNMKLLETNISPSNKVADEKL